MVNKRGNKGQLWTQSSVSSMAGRERWVLLGDYPKQELPIGALWPSQHYRTDRSLQDPCRLSSGSTMPSFQHCQGSRWGFVSFTCTSGFPSKGNAGPQVQRISHTLSVYTLMEEVVGQAAEHGFPAVWMHILGSGLQGEKQSTLVVLQSSLLFSRTSKSLCQIQMKYRVNYYLLLKLCSGFSVPPNSEKYQLWIQILFIIWNEIQVLLSKVLLLILIMHIL